MSAPESAHTLRLLGIFHYVQAFLIAAMATLPVIHLAFGVMMLSHPEMMQGGDCNGGPCTPEFTSMMGGFFVAFASVFMLLGYGLAILTALSGRFLTRTRHYTYCITLAAVNCMIIPTGTVLGVFTLTTLLKPPVAEAFQASKQA